MLSTQFKSRGKYKKKNKGKKHKKLTHKVIRQLKKLKKTKSKLKKTKSKLKKTKKKSINNGEKYICYTGISNVVKKNNGIYTEKEFLKEMEEGGHAFSGDKRKFKTLEQWIDHVGAIKGKCLPYLYYFSEEGCNKCKSFDPIWESLEKGVLKNDVFFNKIMMDDSGYIQDILKKFNVKKFPSLVYQSLKDDKGNEKYNHFKGDFRKIKEMDIINFVDINILNNDVK